MEDSINDPISLQSVVFYDRKNIYNRFYKETIRQARIAGYSSFQLLGLIFTFMFHYLQTYKYGQHYQNYKIVTDQSELQEIIASLSIAINFNDLQQQKMSINQSVSRYMFLKLILRDKYIGKSNYVSLSEKQIAYWKYKTLGKTVILDHSGQSTFRRPSFFITLDNNQYNIVIRGTSNSEDAFTDLDQTPELHHGYKFHVGFYSGAEYIFKIANNIIDKKYDVLIVGHSMGASIAVILTFLLRLQNFNAKTINGGQSCVGDYEFSILAKSFSKTIINGFDFIPVISYHSEMVMLMRMKLQMLRIKSKFSNNFSNVEDFDNATVIQNEDNNFSYCEKQCVENLGYRPEIRILSRYMTRKNDLFIAGKIYQFIKGNLIEVSVHDISDLYFTVQGVFDHVGYHYLVAELQKKI
ncbi:Lipase (Class 3) and transmembrane domain-containing protein [Spironucleus salmonicida]|uniref:sn-1-specific diacylglycerol lipase n=1 Tax=Spironucleus salmonicida TaxID=348837 RepID=V6LSW5_9EUKA|nr:Lipase (Class 3) and transmembrane domain-containing protein [Spironucleus salmonicida]|eukprot:EST43889.1 Lipase (class 3) and transmembrane domain-containing protein [Spironucleus salmonicida]